MEKTSHFSAYIFIGIVLIGIILVYFFGNNNMSDTSSVDTSSVNKGAILETSQGNIEIAFIKGKATSTIDNFVTLSGKQFYDGTKFHRVIKNFMIQGGDPLSKGDNVALYGSGGPGYNFPDEINDERMVRGMVAMANAGPNTNGSQFFIITAVETPWLYGKHTVFAKVISGMDVVSKIEAVSTGKNDVPTVPVIINKVILK